MTVFTAKGNKLVKAEDIGTQLQEQLNNSNLLLGNKWLGFLQWPSTGRKESHVGLNKLASFVPKVMSYKMAQAEIINPEFIDKFESPG